MSPRSVRMCSSYSAHGEPGEPRGESVAGGQTAVTHDAAARVAQGRGAGRARRVTLVGLALVMVALAALGWWAVWWSPLLDVRRVEVVGAHHVSAADIQT